MSEFFGKELCRDLNMGPAQPGKRLFRVEIAPGRSVIIGAEVELDCGAGFARQVPTDREVCEGIERAAAMMRPKALRGGQS